MEIFYERGKKYNCRVKGIPYFRKSVTINGKRYSFYGDGEKDALAKIADAVDKASKGLNYDNRQSRVGTVFRYWLYNVKRVDSNVKASTFSRYDAIWRNHIEPYPICNHLLSSLDSATLQRYITEQYEREGKSPATVKYIVKLFKMFCDYALDEGYIIKNPCRHLSVPGTKTSDQDKRETFSQEEIKKIFDYMDNSKYQYDTVIRLAFATGMRLGELLALRWKDVGNDVITVRQSTSKVSIIDADGNRTSERITGNPKTLNAIRNIPILESTAAMLREHKRKQMAFFVKHNIPTSEYVFTTDKGRIIDHASMRKSFMSLLKRAGVEYKRFHCIRHTFATEAIRRGVDVKDVQLLMGHSDISITYIYVESNDESKREAIERMGEIAK